MMIRSWVYFAWVNSVTGPQAAQPPHDPSTMQSDQPSGVRFPRVRRPMPTTNTGRARQLELLIADAVRAPARPTGSQG
jgi:hypothetical protein